MKIRFLALAAVLLTVFVLMSGIALADDNPDFNGGSGTENDPYKIATPEQLQNIGKGEYLNLYFILEKDISLTGKSWNPIGTKDDPFKGVFDGNGKTISGLEINEPEQDYIGLFGYAENAVFSNVILTDISLTGRYCVGGLAGSVLGTGTFIDCSVSGTEGGAVKITAGYYAGGLAGSVYNGEFTNCFVSSSGDGAVTITSNRNCVGGLAGYVYNGEFTDCSASGTGAGAVTITANGDYAGGLAGYV
ncbi:hypothetical protein LJC08_04110, partial [Methanimicrococcus sp. OttesenSCG-928-J09]|nr:hypothetical protein [Methanimicrococcus sp. OttesenSCG-928-J09]